MVHLEEGYRTNVCNNKYSDANNKTLIITNFSLNKRNPMNKLPEYKELNIFLQRQFVGVNDIQIEHFHSPFLCPYFVKSMKKYHILFHPSLSEEWKKG